MYISTCGAAELGISCWGTLGCGAIDTVNVSQGLPLIIISSALEIVSVLNHAAGMTLCISTCEAAELGISWSGTLRWGASE